LQPSPEIAPESESVFRHGLPTNNIFGVILYDLKDSNNSIYILLNTVWTKNTAVKRVNVVTKEKNVVTINRRTKVKRRSMRNLARYMLSSLTTTMMTNRFIDLSLLLFPLLDPAIRTTFLLSRTFFVA